MPFFKETQEVIIYRIDLLEKDGCAPEESRTPKGQKSGSRWTAEAEENLASESSPKNRTAKPWLSKMPEMEIPEFFLP